LAIGIYNGNFVLGNHSVHRATNLHRFYKK
jgi:hypothetical protein